MSTVIVAVAVVIVLFRFAVKDSKRDAPHLVVVRQTEEEGKNVVVFRFDAPKHTDVLIKGGKAVTPDGFPRLPFAVKDDPLGLYVGKDRSIQFSLIMPRECPEWRLNLIVSVKLKGLCECMQRVHTFLETKSIGAFSWDMWRADEWVESRCITNKVLITASVASQK